jgi:glycosyltransferase involved in cell wall biosynthesis
MEKFHAVIDPVTDGRHRPTWSVLIPCYNCARFLELTLESVLAQDPGPEHMEIMVIDDCSTLDDPGRVVERLGNGRVRFVQQERNVGKVRNYETGLHQSRGHLIHQLHGDDLVLPGFYAAMAEAFGQFQEAGAIFCESDYINEAGGIVGRTGAERNETGLLDDWLRKIAICQRIQTPSMVVRRDVYETLGGFDRRLDSSEDWEMWIRIANRYAVGFCTGARAQYRTSEGNNSTKTFLNGTRARTTRLMFKIVEAYLAEEVVVSIQGERDQAQGLFFAAHLPKVRAAHGMRGVIQLGFEALHFKCNLKVVRRLISVVVQEFRRR